jgi:hypothetical protein
MNNAPGKLRKIIPAPFDFSGNHMGRLNQINNKKYNQKEGNIK